MLRKIRERMESERGFTLIELLVVILIIGILAAIAIPAFLGQRDKATDSDAKSSVRNAASAAGAYYTDGQTYVGMDVDALQDIEPSLNGAELTVSEATADTYTISVESDTDNVFEISRLANGTTERNCTVPEGNDRGGCPSSGEW